MAKEDKYADELISDEDLEFVVGGTRAETQELITAIYSHLYKTDISGLFDMNSAEVNIGLKNVLEDELASFGIKSRIDVGLNGTGIDEKANEYYTGKGNAITHQQLMNIFNK